MLVGLVIVVALLLAVVLVWLGRRTREIVEKPTPEETAGGRLLAEPADFHVKGDTATVSFDVPLPDPVDEVLSQLLLSQAVEVVRLRRSHGLPLDTVTVVRVMGKRDGEWVEAGSLELETPGTLPPPATHELVAHVDEFDPLEALARADLSPERVQAEGSRGDELPPLAADIRLTAELEAALRTAGVAPETATASELTLGLLGASGYQVSESTKPGTYTAVGAGGRTFISVVDHNAGEYPELEEGAINEFLAGFMSSGADRGMLFSDKFCPFVVYEKERREPRIRFITRERMQAFVDSVAMR